MKKTKKRKKPQPREGSSPRDKYLRQKFNISEEEYNSALAEQNGKCKGCLYVPTTVSLHVDHNHEIANRKVLSEKKNGVWWAYPENQAGIFNFEESAKTKSLAIRAVKRRLLRYSVRGLVCWHCNASIKKLRDSWAIAQNLSKFLFEYYQFLDGRIDKRNGLPK